jgi:plastocyanin
MKKIRLISVMVFLMLTVSFSGCLERSSSQTNVVEIKNLAYQPSSITISPGTTITWINKDPMDHTVTATDGSFNSGNIASGGKYNLTFSKEGTYQYQCLIHDSMAGEVTVTAKEARSAQATASQTENIASHYATNRQNSSQQSVPMVGLKLIAQGLSAPMEFVTSNDGSGRMFAVDQIGKIMIVTANGKMLEDPFLDIQSRMVKLSPKYDERGLLGLAFHPDFARNGRFFVFYSAPLRPAALAGWSCTNRLSEFKISKEDPSKVDMSSEQVLFQVDKPQSNHNGGTIAFGPDGYLYVPLGDGGGGNDVGAGHAPEGNGQNTSTLLGKILRIDVNNKSAGA